MIPIETAMQNLADWQAPGEERRSLRIAPEGQNWSATITADRCDAVGCLVWEIALDTTKPASCSLEEWAANIAGRFQGLHEEVKVVEVDRLRNEALLRSETPTARGDEVRYYEIRLQGTARMLLKRFHGSRQPGLRREQKAFPLTHEMLARLLSDLTAD